MLVQEVLSEVAMNPTAFAQSVEQGQQRGVLVGFEFEVCVPAEVLGDVPTADNIDKRLIDELESKYNIFGTELLEVPEKVKKFDRLFEPIKGKSKFATADEAYDSLRFDRLNKAKEIFNQIPEEDRAAILQRMQRAYGRDKFEAMKRDQLNFVNQFTTYAFDYSQGRNVRLNNLALKMYNETKVNFVDVLEHMIGETEFKLSDYFEFDPEQIYREYNLRQYTDDGEYPQYAKTAQVLKPALEQTMGKRVNIFSQYHERKKNLTDWYIEPDRSITVNNDGDGIAEIVGPPEPPQQALQSLKQFYAMAQQLKLYTNKSTGCHINVSIPDNIDLLKLTLFLGDTHVLKQFGREFNPYAVSSEKTVTQKVSQYQAKKKPKLTGPSANKINTDILLKLAQDATSTHDASISNNGKYISFRQTGGNYLARFDDVINVVGRFVRAVVIASDPMAYREQYEAMKYKLAMTNAKPSPASQIQQVQAQGVPGYRLYIQRMTRNAKLEKPATFEEVFKVMNLAKYFELGQVVLNSVEARQVLARANSNQEPGPVDAYATVELLGSQGPNTVLPFETNKVGKVIDGDYHKVAVYLAEPIAVPATDPKAQQYLLKLRKQAVGAKK